MVYPHLVYKVDNIGSYEGLSDFTNVCYICYRLFCVVFREREYLDGNIFNAISVVFRHFVLIIYNYVC
jgi:hypothetical protein